MRGRTRSHHDLVKSFLGTGNSRTRDLEERLNWKGAGAGGRGRSHGSSHPCLAFRRAGTGVHTSQGLFHFIFAAACDCHHLFYTAGNGGPGMLTILPRVTELVSGGAREARQRGAELGSQPPAALLKGAHSPYMWFASIPEKFQE